MNSISHILVPVDFSEGCLGMLHYAKEIAEHYGAEITLLHVVDTVNAGPMLDMAELEAACRLALDTASARLAAFGEGELRGVAVRRLAQEGDPAKKIAAFVQGERVSLVVMPTRGLGPLRRFLVGSVTAKALHDVPCPVLTGVHMERFPRHFPAVFSNVACAVGLDGHSQETLKWAARLASGFRAQLNLVHAIPTLEPGFEIPFDGNWKSDVANLAREDLGKLVTACGADVTGIHVLEGEPKKTVCAFAELSGADLLVMGRGARGSSAGNLPTNTYAMIRESPCPVMSI